MLGTETKRPLEGPFALMRMNLDYSVQGLPDLPMASITASEFRSSARTAAHDPTQILSL